MPVFGNFPASVRGKMIGDPFLLESKRLPYQLFQTGPDMEKKLRKAKEFPPAS